MITLQCNDMLKGKYQKNLIEFYNFLPNNEYAKLKSHSCGLIPVFRSTYLMDWYQYLPISVWKDICKGELCKILHYRTDEHTQFWWQRTLWSSVKQNDIIWYPWCFKQLISIGKTELISAFLWFLFFAFLCIKLKQLSQ